MSTRSVIVFKEDINDKAGFCVYQHYDGYPSGMLESIENTFKYAWPLPRYEAMEFAAAFIAGNKREGGGGIYMTTSPQDHGDLEFVYEIGISRNEQLIIRVWTDDAFNKKGEPIFYGRYKDWKNLVENEIKIKKDKEKHLKAILNVKDKISNSLQMIVAKNTNDIEKLYIGAAMEAIEEAYKKMVDKETASK